MTLQPPIQVRDGPSATVTTFVGPSPGGDRSAEPGGGPQGYLVAQKHEYELGVHYHRVSQFQLVVAGSGNIGRHAVKRGAVHYADPLTPYGPIEPGNDGVTYLTLRARSDFGAWHMPDSQSDLAAARAQEQPGMLRRNLTVDAAGVDGTGLVLEERDELRVVVHQLRAGEEVSVEPTRGACRYGYVLDGALSVGSEQAVTTDSLLYGVPRSPYVLRSDTGCTYLELDIPRPHAVA
jgi:hypothetical protein